MYQQQKLPSAAHVKASGQDWLEELLSWQDVYRQLEEAELRYERTRELRPQLAELLKRCSQ